MTANPLSELIGKWREYAQALRRIDQIGVQNARAHELECAAKELEAAITALNRRTPAVEELSESEKDVALAQAVEFAQYVSDAAKGAMVERAKHFLSLPYSQEIAARLTAASSQPAIGKAMSICLVNEFRLPHFASAEIQLFNGYVPKIGDKLYIEPSSPPHIGEGWAIVRPEGKVELVSIRGSEHAAQWSIGSWPAMKEKGFRCIKIQIAASPAAEQGGGGEG